VLRIEGWDDESGLLGLGAARVLVIGPQPPTQARPGPLGVETKADNAVC
jgi:hypothetical protein